MTDFTLLDPLDFRKITNLYLYGQETTPQSYDERIRPADAPIVNVNVDASFWNASGPGRFAMPAINDFVKSFFENPAGLPPAVLQLFSSHLAAQGGVGPVSLSVAELKAVLPASTFRFSFAQYGYDSSSSDYAARTYIYNNETFNVSDSTTFVFNTDMSPSNITDLKLVADPDNFDFNSTPGSVAQIGNYVVLHSNIDPFDIGKLINLNIPDSPVRSQYDLANYNAEKAVVQTYSNTITTLVTATFPAMLGVLDALKVSPPVYEYDYNGTEIIYGTSGNDSSSYFVSRTTATDPAKPLIMVGGAGNDSMNGQDGNDSLIGGQDNDTLRGGKGNDYLDGGKGIDVALFDDRSGGTIHLGSGGSAPSDPGLTPTDTAPFFTVTRGAEVDTLHSIEKLVLSDGADTLKIHASTDLGGLQEIDAGANPSGTKDTIDLSQLGRGYSIVDGALVGNGANVELINFEQIIGLSTDDKIVLQQGSVTDIHGGAGNDTIIGGQTKANLFGDDGNDTLIAGSAGDTLDGGVSDGDGDILVGGAGADTFVIGNGVHANQGTDAVFQIRNAGENDRLVLRLSDTAGASEANGTKGILLTGGTAVPLNPMMGSDRFLIAGVSNTVVSPAEINVGGDGADIRSYSIENVRPELGNYFIAYYWDKVASSLELIITTAYGDFDVNVANFHEGDLGIHFNVTTQPLDQCFLGTDISGGVVQQCWDNYHSLILPQIENTQVVDLPSPGDFVPGSFVPWVPTTPVINGIFQPPAFSMYPASDEDRQGDHLDPKEGAVVGQQSPPPANDNGTKKPPFADNHQNPLQKHDPLVLDLNGDGLSLTAIASSSAFVDFKSNGFATHTGWVVPTEGILVDNTGGLNASAVLGVTSGDGFGDLSHYDSNNDGKVDGSDANFDNLSVWIDANGDGQIASNELHSLVEEGISAFNLDAVATSDTINGNAVTQTATYIKSDSSVGTIAAIGFQVDPFQSHFIPGDGFQLNPDVLSLPNLAGYGVVPELKYSMSLDDNLFNQVTGIVQHAHEMTGAQFQHAFEDFLLAWTGASAVDPSSQGGLIDARHLAVVEAIYGQTFEEVNGAGAVLDQATANAIDAAYHSILDSMEIRFVSQLPAAEYGNGVASSNIQASPFYPFLSISYDVASDTISANFDQLIASIVGNAPVDSAGAEHYFDVAARLIEALRVDLFGEDLGALTTAFNDAAASAGLADGVRNQVVAEINAISIVDAAGAGSVVSGTGEADLILAGVADQTLSGLSGSDTYIYAKGDGNVIIDDAGNSSSDKLIFTDVNPSDVVLTTASNGQDVLITVNGGQSVVLKGQLSTDGTSVIESVQFGNGTVWSETDIRNELSQPINHPPVTVASDVTATHGQSLDASSLFSVSDAENDAITGYQFYDATATASSGHWVANGVAQGANAAIDVTPDQLSQTSFLANYGSDDLYVRANDGTSWGAWTEFHVTAPADQSPVATASDVTADRGTSLAASLLFTVSDAENDAITAYQFYDATTTASSGHWVVNGVAEGANAAIDVTPDQLAQTSFLTNYGTDDLYVRANDGTSWGAWTLFHVTAPANLAPVTTALDAAATHGQSFDATSLFTISDAENDAITGYQFYDATATASSGHWVVNGVAQGANAAIDVTPEQLAQTSFLTNYGTDDLYVRANDGISWGAWTLFHVTAPANQSAVASASDVTATHGQSFDATSLFTVSDAENDAVTAYQFYDATATASSGHWVVNGVAQGGNATIDVTPDQMAQTSFLTNYGTDDLYVRANDGTSWGAWTLFHVTAPANQAAVATASDVTATHGQSFDAASLFTISDAENDAITGYQFYDATATTSSGHWVVNGAAQGANATIDVTPDQLSQTSFLTNFGTDDLYVRANDGTSWGAWTLFHVTAPANQAAVTTASDVTAARGVSLDASSLFTVSDAENDAITAYQFYDSTATASSGHWVVNGVAQGANATIDVTPDQLSQTSFLTNFGTDDLYVRANDGTNWGAWTLFHVTAPANQAPIVTGGDISLPLSSSVAASALFSVSDAEDDAITTYQFWDSNAAATSAHWALNGVEQDANQAITVLAADLNEAALVAGSAPDSDMLWVRANDGTSWSDWHSLSAVSHA